MTSSNCLLCEKTCEIKNNLKYNCSYCGKYSIPFYEPGSEESDKLSTLFSNNKENIKKNLHNIRGYLKDNERYTISVENFEYLVNLKSLKVNGKLKKLMRFLYDKTDIGQVLNVEVQDNGLITSLKLNNASDINLIPVVWAKDNTEILHLIDILIDKKLLSEEGRRGSLSNRKIKIAFDGFEYIEKSENTPSDIGFCAMSFDSSMNEVWDKSISLAISDAGYSPKRVDSHEHNNVILEEIEGLIRQSKFIVSDLTKQKCGVYFEAGFAKASQIPIIYTCETEDFENIHFDIRHFYCLKWDKKNLPDFKERLQKMIENIFRKGNFYKYDS